MTVVQTNPATSLDRARTIAQQVSEKIAYRLTRNRYFELMHIEV